MIDLYTENVVLCELLIETQK